MVAWNRLKVHSTVTKAGSTLPASYLEKINAAQGTSAT